MLGIAFPDHVVVSDTAVTSLREQMPCEVGSRSPGRLSDAGR